MKQKDIIVKINQIYQSYKKQQQEKRKKMIDILHDVEKVEEKIIRKKVK